MSSTALKSMPAPAAGFDPQLEAELAQALALAAAPPEDLSDDGEDAAFNPALSALDAAFPRALSGGAALARAKRRQALAEDQKRAFLRTVSHELRTPLNAIIGFSEILSAELYGPMGAPQYKDYARIVHDSGHRLLRLVNQVLEIARLEGQAVDLRMGPESVDAAVEECRDALGAELKAQDVTIEVRAQGRLPDVHADARGLRTVLTNLLQNAVRHSPKGGTVTVSALRVEAGMIEITVADHGEGVEAAELSRLLRPFEQGGSSLTRHSQGAGLGLPIADLTCRAMDGSLRLSSTPGAGLSASVRLKSA
jgi:signal transduction histidine kinase